MRIEAESAVPFGSGLGGSSALLVAIVSALARLSGEALDAARVIAVCRDAETRVLARPAGTQDYEPALRGGLNVIAHEAGGARVRTMSTRSLPLAESLVLWDSGRSHSSGLNNWEIYKARIDGDDSVRRALDGIRDAAAAMAEAAGAGDVERMGSALSDEWAHRRELSPRVATPALDEGEARARAAGAWGAKACGAGGGGVLAVLAPPAARARVADALAAIGGGALLDAGPEDAGVRVEV